MENAVKEETFHGQGDLTSTLEESTSLIFLKVCTQVPLVQQKCHEQTFGERIKGN